MVLSGFFHNLPLSFKIFALICAVYLFFYYVFADDYPPLSLRFHLPPQSGYTGVLVFFPRYFHKLTCFSHHPILSLRCYNCTDRPVIVHPFWNAKGKLGFKCCVCMCFSFPVFCFIWTWLLTTGAIERTDYLSLSHSSMHSLVLHLLLLPSP